MPERAISLRCGERVIVWADTIADALRQRGEYDLDTGGDLSRSTVLRRALELGLLELAHREGVGLRRTQPR